MFSGTARFLVAMPSLKSTIFSNSVILMANHDSSGALGFIINLPTGTKMDEVFELMEIEYTGHLDVPVLFGGPVSPEFFWFIHSAEFIGKSTIKTHTDFYLTGAGELIPLLGTSDCPDIYYGGIGYSGWAELQLDREIEEGSWWMGDFDLKLLFETDMSERWNEAFKSLGADPDNIIDNSDPFDPTIN